MTPEQLEHFCLLKKHLENLLATAAKRTPGEWMKTNLADIFTDTEDARRGVAGNHIADCDPSNEKTCEAASADARFITSCAGPAEAGWRSTMAAIDLLLEMERQGCSFSYFPTAESILAEWPLASLKS